MSKVSSGSLRLSDNTFQTNGLATENARQPNVFRRHRGTISFCWAADRRYWRPVTSDADVRYCGAVPLPCGEGTSLAETAQCKPLFIRIGPSRPRLLCTNWSVSSSGIGQQTTRESSVVNGNTKRCNRLTRDLAASAGEQLRANETEIRVGPMGPRGTVIKEVRISASASMMTAFRMD